jgi:UPF0755 protein
VRGLLAAFVVPIMLGLVFALAATIFLYYGYFVPPEDFPIHTVITIPEGATLEEAAEHLKGQKIVQSGLAFQNLILILGGEGAVQAGDYFFDRPMTIYEVAVRVITGDFGLKPQKVRIVEGMTTYQIAELLEGKLGRFDAITFLELSKDKEGYLFPDTYYFLPNATAQQVVDIMEQTFYERIQPLEEKIAAFGRPLHDVVTMASLLEREARWLEERQIIAGILWKRIEIEMPLQVDAVFGYIYQTKTFSPKYSHLKVESPYNTYTNKGLPPGPIANPSLSSIEAAVTPIESSYLFYLTGRDGTMHYSTNFSEHVRKKNLYLN